jgi:hypothetical protein
VKITEKKLREAQEVIEAMMDKCGLDTIRFNSMLPIYAFPANGKLTDSPIKNNSLPDLYISRLHELEGSQEPPF